MEEPLQKASDLAWTEARQALTRDLRERHIRERRAPLDSVWTSDQILQTYGMLWSSRERRKDYAQEATRMKYIGRPDLAALYDARIAGEDTLILMCLEIVADDLSSEEEENTGTTGMKP